MDDPTTATDADTAEVSTSSPTDADNNATAITSTTSSAVADRPSSVDSGAAFQAAVHSLSSLIPDLPLSSVSSVTDLLNDSAVASHISTLLRSPDSGSGDDNMCRWLYDTFHTGNPGLQLVVLRYVPIIAASYLSRAAHRRPLAGFEAVLLALYAHVTALRGGQSMTVTVPDVSHPSVYHETRDHPKNNIATDLNIAVVSPSLEPYGTVRSTRRSRIVGVALDLYFSRISEMPVTSKIDFCDFCLAWVGDSDELIDDGKTDRDNTDGETKTDNDKIDTDGDAKTDSNKIDSDGDGKNDGEAKTDSVAKRKSDTKERRGGRCGGGGGKIPMSWELLQPALRVLGHCLYGPESRRKEKKNEQLLEVASRACRSLYARSLHDVDSRAILATGSLLRLTAIARDRKEVDFTEIEFSNAIVL